jgi:hypothetical protein
MWTAGGSRRRFAEGGLGGYESSRARALPLLTLAWWQLAIFVEAMEGELQVGGRTEREARGERAWALSAHSIWDVSNTKTGEK